MEVTKVVKRVERTDPGVSKLAQEILGIILLEKTLTQEVRKLYEYTSGDYNCGNFQRL